MPPENSKIRKRTFDELVVVVLQRRALLRHGCCCFICARHREEIDGSANGGVRRNVVSLAWMQVPAKFRELPAAVDGARKVVGRSAERQQRRAGCYRFGGLVVMKVLLERVLYSNRERLVEPL